MTDFHLEDVFYESVLYAFAVVKVVYRKDRVINGLTLLFLDDFCPASKFFGFVVANNEKIYTILAWEAIRYDKTG